MLPSGKVPKGVLAVDCQRFCKSGVLELRTNLLLVLVEDSGDGSRNFGWATKPPPPYKAGMGVRHVGPCAQTRTITIRKQNLYWHRDTAKSRTRLLESERIKELEIGLPGHAGIQLLDVCICTFLHPCRTTYTIVVGPGSADFVRSRFLESATPVDSMSPVLILCR